MILWVNNLNMQEKMWAFENYERWEATVFCII